METPIKSVEPRKSLWTRLIEWLGKVLATLAVACAIILTVFTHQYRILDTGNHKENIIVTGLFFVVVFFVLYVLFSLLKHLILAAMILGFIVFAIIITSNLTHANRQTSFQKDTSGEGIYFVMQNFYRDTTVGGEIKTLTDSIDTLAKRVDALRKKDSSEKWSRE